MVGKLQRVFKERAIEAAKAVLRKNNNGTRAAARAAEVAGAAGDAAGDAMKEKIIRYGLKLHLKGGL